MLIHSRGGRATIGTTAVRIIIPVTGTIRWIEIDCSWTLDTPATVASYAGYGVLALSEAPLYGWNTTGTGQDSNVLAGVKVRYNQSTASTSFQGQERVVIPDTRFKVTRGQDLWNVTLLTPGGWGMETDIMFLID
jgi:hypothetical protein